jgi:hypothetical protein
MTSPSPSLGQRGDLVKLEDRHWAEHDRDANDVRRSSRAAVGRGSAEAAGAGAPAHRIAAFCVR